MSEDTKATLREYMEPVIFALLFISSVYLEKFVRSE